MSYISYDEWCSESSNFKNEIQWTYKYVGTLKNFQGSVFKFLQNEDDVIRLLDDYRIDDDFRYYMVVSKDGDDNYSRIFGVSGITLDSHVYEYRVMG